MTARQHFALTILASTPRIRALEFAEKFWPGSHVLRAISNQGHGACRGKKAWLCGGSYLGRLIKLGWVKSDYEGTRSNTRIVYSLTMAGRSAIQ